MLHHHVRFVLVRSCLFLSEFYAQLSGTTRSLTQGMDDAANSPEQVGDPLARSIPPWGQGCSFGASGLS